jgi:hypothetical protein
VSERLEKLRLAHADWANARGLALQLFPGGAYVMFHSLAHALMAEIALKCGYPASAIKERIYAIRDEVPSRGRYGLLLYTPRLARRARWAGSSRSRRGWQPSSSNRSTGWTSARAIRCAPTTIPLRPSTSARSRAPLATAACSSPRRAASAATSRSTAP